MVNVFSGMVVAMGKNAMQRAALALVALVTLASAGEAAAQAVPVTITFAGQVANDPAQSIMLRSLDPATGVTLVPFGGSAPAYAYNQGDAVTFTLTTSLPSAADLASGRYDAARQADGTYRIGLIGPNNAGTFAGVGVVSNFDVSGPIAMTLNSGQPLGGGGLAVVIDPADYSYALATTSGWSFATFDAPGYTYDPISGSMSAASTTCAFRGACALNGDGGFRLAGDLLSAAAGNIPIHDAAGGVRGFFSMLFSGQWSLPAYTPGGATQVPEPGTMLLFGAGAAAVLRRARRRQQGKTTA